ncbi:Hydrocephalus-Inducing Protein [Manis pentadactyla]|nr:Hydrocephalus-Inducing Protein [Manis pentadactyla]
MTIPATSGSSASVLENNLLLSEAQGHGSSWRRIHHQGNTCHLLKSPGLLTAPPPPGRLCWTQRRASWNRTEICFRIAL